MRGVALFCGSDPAAPLEAHRVNPRFTFGVEAQDLFRLLDSAHWGAAKRVQNMEPTARC